MATTADFLWERLIAWGVKRVYGYPGDGIGGIIGALARTNGAIEFIQVRHEEMAAFMATAHAKFTGELGVCLATSGPGAIHLLNGLYDAKADHMAVLAIVGQAATTALGGDYQQEVDLPSLFKDVAHEYLINVVNPAQMRHAVDRSVRTALAYRQPTAIIVPKDVQEMAAEPHPAHAHNTIHSGVGYERPHIIPNAADLQRAAAILNAGERVAILVGAGAIGAAEEVLAIADVLDAGIAKALLGKAVLPDDLPFVTGTLGLLGTKPSSDMMKAADTLLMIGTTFPYAEFLPKEGAVRAVQIDIDARNLAIRYPCDVNLTGDAADTLFALLPLLQKRERGAWRERIARDKDDFGRVERKRAADSGQPINPQLVFTELSPRLPDLAIITADAGTTANWSARNLDLRGGMKYSLSGGLASMGSAVPYAIAAKFAFPARPVIALAGDGAMQMNGSAELLTIAKYWRQWSDPRLIVLVLNNRDLNQVTWEQRVESGDPKFPASQDLPDFPYAAYAESIGLHGIRCDDPGQIGDAWDRALGSQRPCVLEAVTDPNIFILPPQITFGQARNFMTALAKGDADDANIIRSTTRGMLDQLLPH
jgi:pyruvate dehydrogenase (quinone)